MLTTDKSHAYVENRKVEIAKVLLALKNLTTSETYSQIKTLLVAPDDNDLVERTVSGLSEEDEFAMMCRLIGTTTHLVPLNQRQIIQGDYTVPDFLACFRPGCYHLRLSETTCEGLRCLVEVKSTVNDKYKIGGNKLARLRSFASRFELPLIFAVRFLRFNNHALWIIVEDDPARSSLTIDYSHLTSGIRQVLWDDYFFMLMPDIQFRVVYERKGPESGIYHQHFGWQRDYQVVCDKVDGQEKYPGSENTLFHAFFESFNLDEISIRQDGDTTIQILKPLQQYVSLADVLYSMNRLPVDKSGQAVFDSSRILSGIQSEDGLVSRLLVERFVTEINKNILGVVTIGDPEKHFEKWKRLCKPFPIGSSI